MAAIGLDCIVKSFGRTQVLRGVSLQVDDGDFVALIGPSGCGKSTLLRILAGLESVDSGKVAIAGQDVTRLRASDRDLAMVFQSYALYPHLTVAENIAVPMRMRDLSVLQRLPVAGRFLPGARHVNNSIADRVLEAARSLEIEHLLDRKPGQLSGGQRQRVALGRALVRKPVAFLLDEPLSNLDAKLRVHTRAEIAQLHRQLKATFVYVTHDQVEAMTMADRIAVMLDGRILQVDTPDAVYRDPAHIFVATFIGTPRIATFPVKSGPDGRVSVGQLQLGSVSTPSSLTIAVRPEHLRIAQCAEGLVGHVTHVENLGHQSFVHIAITVASEPVVLRRDADDAALAPGQAVTITFDPARAHLFDATGMRTQLKVAAKSARVAA